MNKTILNLGPQHPSTHGVLRIKAEIEGETIITCEPNIGYLHRGLEKIGEMRNPVKYLPLVDRIDYVSGFFYSYLYCSAIEKLNNIEVPKDANIIRVMFMELNRISSHLLWLGTYLLDLGAISPIFYTFRERELIINYFEKITGQRMMYNYFVFGGIRHNNIFLDNVSSIIKIIVDKISEYEKLISNNPIFLSRTKNIGLIKKKDVFDYAITGVNLRASGIVSDYRKNMDIYNDYEFNVITSNKYDCYSRYLVRIEEMKESIKIIEQCIEKIKSIGLKEHKQIIINKIQTGETYSYVESPRGLSICYINSVGDTKPYRVKWRTGSFYTVQLLKKILKNTTISDAISIYGSLDVILPEVDR